VRGLFSTADICWAHAAVAPNDTIAKAVAKLFARKRVLFEVLVMPVPRYIPRLDRTILAVQAPLLPGWYNEIKAICRRVFSRFI